MSQKKKKLLEKIIIICLIIISVEVIAMGVIKFVRERNIDHLNSLNDLIKVEDGYIGVGFSDFHQNKYIDQKTYQFTEPVSKRKQNIIASQSRIVKYDEKMNIIWENSYKGAYDSVFNSVIETKDGYVAVGYYADDYKQIVNNSRTAMIVKYNKNGKQVWDKTYHVLSDTKFNKIIEDDGNYIVIGQSIYENLEMGTHVIGGGIIVKYSSDGEELAHNNYGGNKSGNFHDIVKVDDGYIVCGKDAANYGVVLKFSKDFNREENDLRLISEKIKWQRTYANTDETGFNSMVMINDKIYVVGALNISNEKDKDDKKIYNYDAGFVIYNTKGKYLGKYVMNKEKHHRFNSVIADEKYLYLSMNMDVDSYDKGGNRKTSIIQYSIEEEKIVGEKEFGINNYIINSIVKIDDKRMMVGTSNDKCGLLGCDYYDVHEYFNDVE